MKSERGNSRPGAPAPAPAQGSLRPAHMPPPGPATQRPSPSLASGSSSSSPLRGCWSVFSSSDSWPSAAPGGKAEVSLEEAEGEDRGIRKEVGRLHRTCPRGIHVALTVLCNR